MIKKRPLIVVLILIMLAACVLLVPVLLLILGDLWTSYASGSFYQCKVMNLAQLEEAMRQGLKVNDRCCTEHMFGECSFGRVNSTPLVFAIESGDLEGARSLISHGADVNQGSESGYPLGLAVSIGRLDLVQLLLSNKIEDESKSIAYRMAAHTGDLEIVKAILVKEPADRRADACAQIACSLATELEQIGSSKIQRQREMMLYLINDRLDPNVFCETTTLFSRLALKDEHAPLIEALLNRGADLNLKERNGKTVKEYVRSFWDYNSRGKVKELVERGK